MRADGNSLQSDFDVLIQSKLNSAKIMTNTSFDEFDKLRTLIQAKNIILRLFSDGNDGQLFYPNKFFEHSKLWLDRFASKGGIYIEIHNEPNLVVEGCGTFWMNGKEFAQFFSQMSDLIHNNYSSLKVGYPGLSPNQPNSLDFEQTIPDLIKLKKIDWIGAHSYWIDNNTMNTLHDGRYYRRFLNKGVPVIITEFANVGNTDTDLVKGQQYKNYYNTLEKDVLGAIAFISSASNKIFNDTRQTWVRNNKITDIVKGLI